MKRFYVLIVFIILVSLQLWAINPLKPEMLKKGEFAQRRQAFMEKMDGGIAIFLGTEPVIRNGDIQHEFRQKSDYYYLTGFEEPMSAFVLIPGAEEKFIMFVWPRDPRLESWHGEYDGIDEAKSIYGADAAYPFREFESMLPRLVRGKKKIYCSFDQEKIYDQLKKMLKSAWAAKDTVLIDPRAIIAKQRVIKSHDELLTLQKAVDITGNAQMELMKAMHPGMYEYEGSSLLLYQFRKQGADREGCQFIVASGPNGAVLHYSKGIRQCQPGELVLIDIGAEYGYYSADITRTYPVDGKFTKEQKEIYQLVLDSQKKTIEAIRPGVGFKVMMMKSVEYLKEGLFKLGLNTEKNSDWQTKVWMKYFNVCHWIGLDIHDVGEYNWQSEEGRILEPGMVFAVEPGIYVDRKVLDLLPEMLPPGVSKEEVEKFIQRVRPVFEKYKNINVRIEDDVLVTKDGYKILSNSVPKSIKDIEKMMKQKSIYN